MSADADEATAIFTGGRGINLPLRSALARFGLTRVAVQDLPLDGAPSRSWHGTRHRFWPAVDWRTPWLTASGAS
jgi:hypothetical protein